jgi:hypothetical protein
VVNDAQALEDDGSGTQVPATALAERVSRPMTIINPVAEEEEEKAEVFEEVLLNATEGNENQNDSM